MPIVPDITPIAITRHPFGINIDTAPAGKFGSNTKLTGLGRLIEVHEQALCNLLGADMAAGLIPNDLKVVGGMVRNICFANARAYFGLELAPEFANRK